MRLKFISCLGLFTALSALSIQAESSNPFIGIWKPNVEATLEVARTAPDFKPEEAETIEKILTTMVASMRMQVSAETLEIRMGKSRSQSIAYQKVNATEDRLVLLLKVSETKSIPAEILLVGADRIQMAIEGNSDLSAYIWEPAESMEVADPDMSAIISAAVASNPELEKVRDASQEKAIRNNLRQIASAADQYYLENGVTEVSFDQLEGEYFKKLNPIKGEDYSKVELKYSIRSISVTDQDGTVHTYEW